MEEALEALQKDDKALQDEVARHAEVFQGFLAAGNLAGAQLMLNSLDALRRRASPRAAARDALSKLAMNAQAAAARKMQTAARGRTARESSKVARAALVVLQRHGRGRPRRCEYGRMKVAAKGVAATLHGLRSRPELNHLRVCILGQAQPNGRVPIRVRAPDGARRGGA